MQPEILRKLIEDISTGAVSPDAAFNQLAELPFSDIGDAKIDNHRALRCGFAEVVYCKGKDPRDVARIVEEGLRSTPCMLATRAEKAHIDALRERFPQAIINLRGRTVRVGASATMKTRGTVLVVTAGTSDIPVAEEALETLRAFGCEAMHNYDVGVAGLHRILSALPQLKQAGAIICIAGMEGALPSVVGGLVACPVIAVPTSTGYGASFQGLAAMLSMLNTCAAGVSVVNIDNGFGAAMCALRMIADRNYPVIEVPPPVNVVPESEIADTQSASRDIQLSRLEQLVEQLSAQRQQPISISTPAPSAPQTPPELLAQLAKLESRIEQLSAHQPQPVAPISAQQPLPDLRAQLDRLEKLAEQLNQQRQQPISIVTQPIPQSHPELDSQLAKLGKLTAELSATVSKTAARVEEKAEPVAAAPAAAIMSPATELADEVQQTVSEPKVKAAAKPRAKPVKK